VTPATDCPGETLYVNEDLGFDLANTVYALDSTTIDLCLAVSPWAHFRTTNAAVKMHMLLDLRGNATNQPFIPLLPSLVGGGGAMKSVA
jgi:hypothetical protein